MIVTKKPFKWVSAHRDIEFELTPETVPLYSVGTSGFPAVAVFNYLPNGFIMPTVGGRVLVDSGYYQGYHTVVSYNTFDFGGVTYIQVVTSTPYVTTQTTGNLLFELTSIEIGVYKGGGSLWFLNPFEYVAGFTCEINLEGKFVFNISGYVNKIFDVVNSNDSYTYGGLTFKNNLFNNVEIYANIGASNGVFISQHLVLNSAIDMYQLNRDYVDTGKNLNSLDTNFYFSCGITENIQIVGDFVKVVGQYEDGILQTISSYFSPSDFNSDFVLIP